LASRTRSPRTSSEPGRAAARTADARPGQDARRSDTTAQPVARPSSPRLKDVAEAAGVHVSTASRALNDQTAAMVQEETLLRVRHAANELGYRVNGMARALKTRRSMSIGMLVPDITNPFFPPVVRGAESALARAGFSLLLSSTDNDPDKARGQLDAMVEARVDGLLLGSVQRRDPAVDRLRGSGIPAVLFNRTVDDDAISSVVPDDALGVQLAVDHLHELGHRRIGLVVGPLFTSNGERRLRAFRRAARRLGLDFHIVEATAFDEAAGLHATEQMLAEFSGMTAVVAGNDLLALGAIDAGLKAGLRCPRNLSVVGFNDMPLAGRLNPPLTTVNVPELILGQLAAQALLNVIATPDRPPERTVVPVSLVVRGSTAPPR
jgi:LacI family transcriptional regulator